MRGSGAATNGTRICWLSMVYRASGATHPAASRRGHSSAITQKQPRMNSNARPQIPLILSSKTFEPKERRSR